MGKADRVGYAVLFGLYAASLAGLSLLSAHLGCWLNAGLAGAGSLLAVACAGAAAGGGKS